MFITCNLPQRYLNLTDDRHQKQFKLQHRTQQRLQTIHKIPEHLLLF